VTKLEFDREHAGELGRAGDRRRRERPTDFQDAAEPT
jgi:hypothetical protein